MKKKSTIVIVGAVVIIVAILLFSQVAATLPYSTETIEVFATDDSFVSQSYSTTDRSQWTHAYIGFLYQRHHFAYLKFGNLTNIIPGFESAVLKLYLTPFTGAVTSSNMTICLRLVTANWVEAQINSYANRVAYSPTCSITIITGDGLPTGRYSIDITEIVEGWLNNTIPNYGVAFTYQENIENKAIAFETTEGSRSHIPRIEVTYAYNIFGDKL
jgi:hypothetical protein